jgi:hypothetical protein
VARNGRAYGRNVQATLPAVNPSSSFTPQIHCLSADFPLPPYEGNGSATCTLFLSFCPAFDSCRHLSSVVKFSSVVSKSQQAASTSVQLLLLQGVEYARSLSVGRFLLGKRID